MAIKAIFLDDGGVMNDNELRGQQWQRLIGEFMPKRLGGEIHDWSKANSLTIREVFKEYEPRWHNEPLAELYEDYLFDWLRLMCERVGVSVPRREEAVSIAREANAYVTRRVHATYPGAGNAIRQLGAKGYKLHTASTEHSTELGGYLEAMGVRELFGRLYGPDLLDLPLYGPQYYRRLFEDSGTPAVQCLVVDDRPQRVAWAIDAGATAVLVSPDHPVSSAGHQVISSLSELPAVLGATISLTGERPRRPAATPTWFRRL